MFQPFRIGTRGSPLALVQANLVRDALISTHGWQPHECEIVPIRTTGDRVQDRALAEIGGKALWTKELDRALLEGDSDCSVHSMKDVETIRPVEIAIAAMLPRADVRDRIIGTDNVAALREAAVVGTSSPRRSAQLLRLRPDLKIVLFRGNVDTRIARVTEGEADATLLAAAGLERLGRNIGTAIPLETMLPAPAQGAVGIEVRADDARARDLISAISHSPTCAAIAAERGLLEALGADCHSPVAAYARVHGARISMTAQLLANDGSAHVIDVTEFGSGDSEAPGSFARDLLARAPASVRALFAS